MSIAEYPRTSFLEPDAHVDLIKRDVSLLCRADETSESFRRNDH
jgi:hypothetical protein